MKKAFSVLLAVVLVAFLILGIYAANENARLSAQCDDACAALGHDVSYVSSRRCYCGVVDGGAK